MNVPMALPGPEFLQRLNASGPALVLTGAGISAGTGIPTYRDERGTWLRSKPITHQEFLQNPRQRQRYWGRSLLGWPAVRDARPAAAHRSLVQMQGLGAVTHIVTQNVDRLHQRAGSQYVTDLHGRLDRVCCLDCGAQVSRDLLQGTLERLNPQINNACNTARPDGDADLGEQFVDSIRVPPCVECGGTLMPDVVFFGGTIPGERIEECRRALDRANSLLVVGSSLQVYSGYRFCRWAAEQEKPIFIINPGVTRADAMAQRWQERADKALTQIVDALRQSSESNLQANGS